MANGLGNPMGAVAARKGQHSLVMLFIGGNRHQALEGMLGADMALSVVNQGQELVIVLRHKHATQSQFTGWDPVANAGAGWAKVLPSPGHRGLPTPMALVVTGLAIGTGGGLSKLAVEPVGIGLVALF